MIRERRIGHHKAWRGDRIVIGGLVLLLLIGFAHPAHADQPTVIVASYAVTPDVLMPGDIGTIMVTLKNTADQATLTESDTYVLPGGLSKTSTTSTAIHADIDSVYLYGNGIDVLKGSFQQVGAIGPGQSVQLTFLVRAPIEDGIFFPELWIRIANGESVKYPIPVNVNTPIAIPKQPAIAIERSVPDTIVPGDDFMINVTLVNTGQSRASDISLRVTTNLTSVATRSPSTYYYERIEPGARETVPIMFVTDRRAPLGIVPIGISVIFADSNGTTTQHAEVVGVRIQGTAEMSVASVSTEPTRITEGDAVTLIVRIENTGTDDARSVRASIDLPLSGTREAFVGKIGPDNDAPAVFQLDADRAGEHEYTLTVSYEDDVGTHETQQRLTLLISPSTGYGPVLAGALVVVFVLAAAYWLLVRKKGD